MVPVNIYEEILWPQFRNLPQIAKLPLNEQVRAYNTYSWDLTTQRMMHESQLAAQGNGGGAPAVGIIGPTPALDCIEFVVDTAVSDIFNLDIESSGPVDYTITWGDGVEETGNIDGTLSISHTYPSLDTSYAAKLCFTDPSLITLLDFIGNA